MTTFSNVLFISVLWTCMHHGKYVYRVQCSKICHIQILSMTMYYRLYSKSDLFIINCQSSLWHFKSGIIWLFFNFPEYKR